MSAPTRSKCAGLGFCVLQKLVQNVGKNTVDFASEQAIGKAKGRVACPESASPLLSFVFCREHQNESHVFFQNFSVLKLSNCKAVPDFFQMIFRVPQTFARVILGSSGRSNTNALVRNSIMFL